VVEGSDRPTARNVEALDFGSNLTPMRDVLGLPNA